MGARPLGLWPVQNRPESREAAQATWPWMSGDPEVAAGRGERDGDSEGREGDREHGAQAHGLSGGDLR